MCLPACLPACRRRRPRWLLAPGPGPARFDLRGCHACAVRAICCRRNGTGYHGYWAKDFNSIDPHLGTEADLLALSKTCHARGMLLMLDVVANHVGPIHSVAQLSTLPAPLNRGSAVHQLSRAPGETLQGYIDAPVSMGAADQPPYGVPGSCWPHYDFGAGCNCTVILDGWFGDLGDLNQSTPAVATYMLDWIERLVKKYDVDGLRLDTVTYVPRPFLEKFHAAAGGELSCCVSCQQAAAWHARAAAAAQPCPWSSAAAALSGLPACPCW
eukprot:SAG22_NODE_4964_length_1121_cov_1.394325_2_plen_269_part_01